MHNKCNVLESSWNHSPTTPVHEKIVFHKTIPGAQKVGGHCRETQSVAQKKENKLID